MIRSDPKSGIRTLQIGRFLAALAVVVYHANGSLGAAKYLGYEVFPFARAGFSGVQFFFVLSGFVITLAHWKELVTSGHPGSFLWKRFRRVHPPLWAALFGVIAVRMWLLPDVGERLSIIPLEVVSAFLALPANRELLLAVEWSLRNEVYFYILFALFLWKPKAGALIGLFVLVVSIILVGRKSPFPYDFFFSEYNILFVMGVVAASIYRRATNLPAAWAAWLAGFGILVFATTWIAVAVNHPLFVSNSTLLFGFGAVFILLGFAVLERTTGVRSPIVLVFLGDASYAIYLVHYPVVSMLDKIGVATRAHTHLPDSILFLAIVVSAVLAGALFHLTVERPLLRIVPRSAPRLTRSGES